MEFNPSGGPTARLSRGTGDFWNVDEARPGETVSKPVEIRRVVDSEQVKVMSSGSAREQQELVLEVLNRW